MQHILTYDRNINSLILHIWHGGTSAQRRNSSDLHVAGLITAVPQSRSDTRQGVDTSATVDKPVEIGTRQGQ